MATQHLKDSCWEKKKKKRVGGMGGIGYKNKFYSEILLEKFCSSQKVHGSPQCPCFFKDAYEETH